MPVYYYYYEILITNLNAKPKRLTKFPDVLFFLKKKRKKERKKRKEKKRESRGFQTIDPEIENRSHHVK